MNYTGLTILCTVLLITMFDVFPMLVLVVA